MNELISGELMSGWLTPIDGQCDAMEHSLPPRPRPKPHNGISIIQVSI